MGIYNPNYSLNARILEKTSRISRRQGELDAFSAAVQLEGWISTLANVDAVHFSTKLEGNVLTHKQVTDALKGLLKGMGPKRDLKEILNYARAKSDLVSVMGKGKNLSIQVVLDTHDQLLNGIVTPGLRGRLRTAQNAIKDAETNRLVYLPPEAGEVEHLLRALLLWQKKELRNGASPLIVASVFHYRFVTIHPFMDGNGRTARLLTNGILYRNGFPVLKYAALEKQHEKNRARYYSELRKLQGPTFYDIPDDVELTGWIEYWLDCLLHAYEEALERMRSAESREEFSPAADKRISQAVGLFRKYKRLSARDYQSLTGLGRTQAVADLKRLLEMNVITRIGGGRSTFYKIDAQ